MRYFIFASFCTVLILFGSLLSGFASRTDFTHSKDSRLNLLIEKATRQVQFANNHDSVALFLDEADKLAGSSNNLHQSFNILLLKGMNEYYLSNYEKAIDIYFKVLELSEQAHDSIIIAKANHYLGMVYDELEDDDESIQFFKKSLDISLVLNDSTLIAKTYQNMAISFQNKLDVKSALEYYEKANLLAILRKDTVMMIDVINNLGTLAYDQHKFEESLDYYWKALDLYQNINDQQGVAFAYNNIGLVYLDKKEEQKSLDYFKKSLALATKLKMYDFTGDIYSNLTIYYEQIKDYKNAYYYYDKYNEVYDSLIGEKKNKMIRQIQAKYQLVKNTRELEELKNKNQHQLDVINSVKSIQVYLVGITIIAILLMIATFYFLFKEKNVARQLEAKTSELHELNLSKDKFFSIIAHDLKNPFNVLVSYTSILKTDLELFSKEELTQIISDLNQASENGFNLLQNLLLWTRSQTNRIHVLKSNFVFFDIFEKVKALVDLNMIAKNQNLTMNIDPDLVVFADKDMIATVLRNLVFNAIKFSPKGSEIKVNAEITGNEVRVDVIDFGIGISKDSIDKLFHIDENTATEGTDGETGTGLGLVICREFIEKNDGKIWAESKLEKGSVFSFTMPLAAKS